MRIASAVSAGGALGAVGRCVVVVGQVGARLGGGLPHGTSPANVLGSFLMGAFVEVTALVWSPSQGVRALLAVGVLGAFMTFSAFSLDAVALFERGAVGSAVAYVLASVALTLAGVFAGMHPFRRVLS